MALLSSIEQQLSELEVLESIYPNKDEVVVDDMNVLTVMQRYLQTNGQSFQPQKMLSITLNLSIEPTCLVVIKSVLPKEYPCAALPDVFARYCTCTSACSY